MENEKNEAKESEIKPAKARIGKRLADFTALYLSNFGRYICSVAVLLIIHTGRNIMRLFRYIWDKTVTLRNDVLTRLKYFLVIIASPFLKVWHALVRAKDDIVTGKKEKGLWNGIKIAASHLGDFIFGKSEIGRAHV